MASFPRAKLLRFNEVAECAPPPGTYEPKLPENTRLGHFDKSQRFVEPKPSISKSANYKIPQIKRSRSFQTPSHTSKRESPSFQRSNSLNNCNTRRNLFEEKAERGQEYCSLGRKNDQDNSGPDKTSPVHCTNCNGLQGSAMCNAKRIMDISHRVKELIKRLECEAEKQETVNEALQQFAVNMPEYKVKLKELEEANHDLNRKIDKLEVEKIACRLQICKRSNKIDELIAIRNTLSIENAKLKEDIIHRKNFITLDQIKVDTLRNELSEEMEKTTKLKTEIAEISQELLLNKVCVERLSKDLSSTQKKMERKEEEHDQLMVHMMHSEEEKNKRIKVVDEEHHRATGLLCLLQDQCDTKQKALDGMHRKINDMKSDFSTLKDMHTQLLEVSTEYLRSLLKEVKQTFTSVECEDSDTSSDNVSSTSKVNVVDPNSLIDKYVMDLKVAVGSIVKTTLEYQEKNQCLERDLKIKNKEIQNLELLIGPFRERLEQYEQEHQALSDITCKARQELEKIALQQAACLGHQNQKQRIRYMVQLKESNLQLKEEVNELQAKLRKKDHVISKITKSNPPDNAMTSHWLPANGEKNSNDENSMLD